MAMNEAIIKDNITAYVEGIISPALVESLHKEETITDEHGDTNVWIVESDTGEDYWVLEGTNPSNLYKKSGIYQTVKNVYLSYIDMLDTQEQRQDIPDRSMYL